MIYKPVNEQIHNRNPRMRNEPHSEWRAEAKVLLGTQIVNTIWPDDVVRSCLNCMFFKEAEVICGKFDVKPPPRIIAFGCIEYFDLMDIPF